MDPDTPGRWVVFWILYGTPTASRGEGGRRKGEGEKVMYSLPMTFIKAHTRCPDLAMWQAQCFGNPLVTSTTKTHPKYLTI